MLLSDLTLLDRTPVEASFGGFPVSQFDKDDVEDLGLLKLDVLGIRMQSAMAHALTEIHRTEDVSVDLDTVPWQDEPTFDLIQRAQTLGCFQIESPGQRELVGKFAPETFNDLVIDISLFRPGPVQSDMIVPFLESRHGWRRRELLHPALDPHLSETAGVVVFHEQVIKIIAELTGCTLAAAEQLRRGFGDSDDRGRDRRPDPLPGARAALPAAGGRAQLGDPQGLCLVRFLQGARGGLRPDHLPVRLAQDAPSGALPGRGAHP